MFVTISTTSPQLRNIQAGEIISIEKRIAGALVTVWYICVQVDRIKQLAVLREK
jgi:hypothetical protein